jgi:phospholipid/cholesterol/gamma-HCH transport system substrate-binding protein
MKFHENKANLEFKVGIFTLVALIILVLGYLWFTQFLENIKYTSLQVEFKNIGKVETGSPVSVRGLKKGKVDEIKLSETGVILDLLVALPRPLPSDSKFYIKEMDMMGSIRLDIVPGVSQQKMDYSKVQTGQKVYGIANLVVRLNHLTDKMQDFVDKVGQEEQIIPQIKNIISSTESFVSKLDNSYNQNEAKLNRVVTGLANLVEELNSFMNINKGSLSSGIARTDTTLKNMNKAVAQFTQVTSNLNKLLQKTQNGKGSLGKIVADEELYDNILKATTTLDSLLKDIKANPGRYFKVKVF